MKICRFCENVIAPHDEICSNCGYNPRTDTMTASFVKKNKPAGFLRKQSKLSPAVKSFAFWGIIISLFSLGIKYQGKFGDIAWNAKNVFLGIRDAKSARSLGKTVPVKATRLIDVRSYKSPVDGSAADNKKIEGIFFDPQGKSYVIINGQLVSEKENFAGWFIKKINSGSVEVVEEGREKLLTVNK
ncbi:MAG: hypothetical protein PHS66_03900 [Candidatus Omnitrophica bacterium]|nr:hypothetical protein [Candidatus Omnitrophota bacterium]